MKDQIKELVVERYLKSTACGLLKTPQACCHPWTNLNVHTPTSVQTYDFSTLYTSIPHNLLKSRITALIHNSFKRRNGSNRCTRIEITSGKGYFTDTINPGGDNLYAADQICRMVEFLIDNIFVNPIPGGGGGGGRYGKFAYPLADLIFRIEEKFFTSPFFFTFNIF